MKRTDDCIQNLNSYTELDKPKNIGLLTPEYMLYMNVDCLVNKASDYKLVGDYEAEDDLDILLDQTHDSYPKEKDPKTKVKLQAHTNVGGETSQKLLIMDSKLNMAYIAGDGLVNTLKGSLSCEDALSVVFSKLLSEICEEADNTYCFPCPAQDDIKLNWETLKGVGFIIKMMKSDYSQFVFEFFPHSVDLLCYQNKLQKLLDTSYNMYIMGMDVNMSEHLINSNITQYVNQLRKVLPAETLGYLDTNDSIRQQSAASVRKCGSSVSQMLDPRNKCNQQQAIDNKLRRRGGNFVYRQSYIHRQNIQLLSNSSVYISNKNMEDMYPDPEYYTGTQSSLSNHFMKQKCPEAYASLTNMGTGNVKLLSPLETALNPGINDNNYMQMVNQQMMNSMSSAPQMSAPQMSAPQMSALPSNSNVSLSSLSGGKKSRSNSKKRFMKKMTSLAKKYQDRDNCSWKQALKKAGKKLASL